MSDHLETLLNFFEKDSRDTFTIYGIALELVSKKEYNKAQEYFNLLLRENPHYVPPTCSTAGSLQRSAVLMKLGRFFNRGKQDRRQTPG
jgi:hypothetical protein